MQPKGAPACSRRQDMEHRNEEAIGRSLREAYELHAGAVLRLCVLVTGGGDQAEDIVQETFLRSAPFIERLREDEVRPYLRATAMNIWRNRLRRLAIERRPRPRSDDPVQIGFEERDALWAAIRRLPPRQRACLVLRFYEDLTESETAEVLGCSLGTVKSQTSRAVAKLRQEMPDGD
jgi:RNA polymerase sigma-70 factor (sigma-E family)